jgi:hypothetical protein
MAVVDTLLLATVLWWHEPHAWQIVRKQFGCGFAEAPEALCLRYTAVVYTLQGVIAMGMRMSTPILAWNWISRSAVLQLFGYRLQPITSLATLIPGVIVFTWLREWIPND